MAKVLERATSLHEEDLVAWLEQQAAHLRSGRLEALDVVDLIEEIEAMVGSRRRELKSRLRVLLMHLLKWDHQPRRRSRSWASTIAEQRAQIQDLLEESPSLRSELVTTTRAAHGRAVERAAIETGLRRHAFPAELPYDLAEIPNAAQSPSDR